MLSTHFRNLRIQSLLKAGVFLFLCVSLSGCMMTSTAVSSIGARTTFGAATVINPENEITIELTDTDLTINSWAMMHGMSIPYADLQRKEGGDIVGNISFKLKDIEWLNIEDGVKIGRFKCKVGNLEKEFEARLAAFKDSKPTKLWLESRYRRWYGYPAQALLVVTVPVDIATDVVIAGVLIVAIPINYGIEAIKGTPTAQ